MSGAEELAPANQPRLGRVLRAFLGAFAGSTGGWIVSALFVPGDSFDWSPGAIACVGCAGLLGAYAGFQVRARWQYGLMGVLVALSAVFWVLAPSGWWASQPPPMPGPISTPR